MTVTIRTLTYMNRRTILVESAHPGHPLEVQIRFKKKSIDCIFRMSGYPVEKTIVLDEAEMRELIAQLWIALKIGRGLDIMPKIETAEAHQIEAQHLVLQDLGGEQPQNSEGKD